jgi:SAM-dependent methyltransferase
MTSSVHTLRETCRGCGSRELRRFLELGPQPLANAFLRAADEFPGERRYPLDVYFCPTCSLVQLMDVIDPSVLFRNYIYVTSTSDTIAEHNERYAATVVELLQLGSEGLVVEVASNDGSLLRRFRGRGVRTLGVEPATNIAEMARAAGIDTVSEFFNFETARKLREERGPADAVIGNNVFAHVDDPQDFLRGAKHLLRDRGLVIIEVPYLGELLDRLEYDTVYHEHICYFSITALLALCNAAGLSIVRIDHVPVHGGSIRMYAGRKERHPDHDSEVLRAAEAEVAQGMTSFERFQRFASEVEETRRALLALLRELEGAGRSLAAYGAPAKGNTLLNYCRIGTELVPYTVDKSPLKVDLYTPGMHLPVLPVQTLLEKQPDYLLILAWNFAEEIMRQQQEYAARGGRFIIPLPHPRVV